VPVSVGGSDRVSPDLELRAFINSDVQIHNEIITLSPHTNSAMPKPDEPLAAVLPPLVFGTATFNAQYNPDPAAMPTTALVGGALDRGVRAFDTSPYYGPAEALLGAALAHPSVAARHPRASYALLTKAGRVSADRFDFRPAAVRASVRRSLQRLRTAYLDVVYAHDVEFAWTAGGERARADVLAAVRELRRLRDEDKVVRYVGVSGYPLEVLAEVAETVLAQTGEPLDAVMAYAHGTLQNGRLWRGAALRRLAAAGVGVVPSASVLGMGLLRRGGVPVDEGGELGDWHPAPRALREAVARAAGWCEQEGGRRIEEVAVRYAMRTWLRRGKEVGVEARAVDGFGEEKGRVGVSVIGVSTLGELEESLRLWRDVVDEFRRAGDGDPGDPEFDAIVEGIQKAIGPHMDFSWDSPSAGFQYREPEEWEEP
jgi:aryl-alcohol dehydrogenase-like predicted oxidoreductase